MWRVLRRFLAAIGLVGLCVTSGVGYAAEAGWRQVQVLKTRVELRPGAGADVAVTIIARRERRHGKTILIVHGMAQTAATFRPLGEKLLTQRDDVSTVLVLDLPGHGASPLPHGMWFGELTLETYANVLLTVLEALPSLGYRPEVVVGQSMGAGIVQLAQQKLSTAGTNLRQRFGVRAAVLLAPVVPSPLPWVAADTGAAATLLAPLVTADADHGTYVAFPSPTWLSVFMSDRVGAIPPKAPSSAIAVARGYIALEAFSAGAEVIGLLGPRPFVSAGVFGPASGTLLAMVTLEQDAYFVFPDEHRALYMHLTGDDGYRLFFSVHGADTVHNVHIFEPARVLEPIEMMLTTITKP